MLVFVAPKIAGGDGISWVAGEGPARMADALALEDVEIERVGDDVLVSGRPSGALAKSPGRG